LNIIYGIPLVFFEHCKMSEEEYIKYCGKWERTWKKDDDIGNMIR
jgi:hypothetical protein